MSSHESIRDHQVPSSGSAAQVAAGGSTAGIKPAGFGSRLVRPAAAASPRAPPHLDHRGEPVASSSTDPGQTPKSGFRPKYQAKFEGLTYRANSGQTVYEPMDPLTMAWLTANELEVEATKNKGKRKEKQAKGKQQPRELKPTKDETQPGKPGKGGQGARKRKQKVTWKKKTGGDALGAAVANMDHELRAVRDAGRELREIAAEEREAQAEERAEREAGVGPHDDEEPDLPEGMDPPPPPPPGGDGPGGPPPPQDAPPQRRTDEIVPEELRDFEIEYNRPTVGMTWWPVVMSAGSFLLATVPVAALSWWIRTQRNAFWMSGARVSYPLLAMKTLEAVKPWVPLAWKAAKLFAGLSVFPTIRTAASIISKWVGLNKKVLRIQLADEDVTPAAVDERVATARSTPLLMASRVGVATLTRTSRTPWVDFMLNWTRPNVQRVRVDVGHLLTTISHRVDLPQLEAADQVRRIQESARGLDLFNVPERLSFNDLHGSASFIAWEIINARRHARQDLAPTGF